MGAAMHQIGHGAAVGQDSFHRARENTKFDEPLHEYSLGGQMGIVESRPRAHGLDRRGLRGKDEVIKLALEGRKAPEAGKVRVISAA